MPCRADARALCTARGFTLIEMVCAIAIVGLIAALVFDGLRFGLRAWHATIQRTQSQHDIWSVQRLLRGRLEQMYPFDAPEAGEPVFPVEGDRTELTFSAPFPPGAHKPGLYRFTVRARPNSAEGYELVALWRPDWNGEAGAAPAAEEVLLEGIRGLEFEYIARGEDAWIQSWKRRPGVPKLVRMRVRFAGDERSIWPDLVVAPRIDADAHCAFDPVSQSCRS